MLEPAQAWDHRVYACRRLPRFLPPDRVGANFRSRAGLLHADVFSVTRSARISCRPGPRLFDFQATVGTGRRYCISIHGRLENVSRSGSVSHRSTLCRNSLLRSRTLASLDAPTLECAHRVAAARAQALSNAFTANILVDAAAHARALE